MWKYLVGGAVVVGLGICWAVQGQTSSGILPYEDPDRVANGKAIYQENCASCHGAKLEGAENWRDRDEDGFLPAPPHDDTGHTWHHPDQQLFLITKLGTEKIVGDGYRSNMIGFGDVLSDQDILDVLAYIKSTWPKTVIERHNQINDRAGS